MSPALSMLQLEKAVIAIDLDCFLNKPRQHHYGRAFTKRLLKTCWLPQEAGEPDVLGKFLDKLQSQTEHRPEGSAPLCPATLTRWRAN